MRTTIRRGAALTYALALAVAGLALAKPAAAAGVYDDKIVLAAGHVDVLYAGQEGGQATLTLHDDTASSDAHRAPEDVLLHVKPSVAQRTASAFVAQLPGFTTVGDTIYVLPQNNVPGTLFAGFGHSLPAGSSVTHSVVALDGPGNVATWQTGDDGPTAFWNTAAGLPTSFTSQANHEHLNWGFTALGEYTLSVQTQITLPGGAVLPTANGTYTFFVGEDLPQVVDPGPEPEPEPEPGPTTELTIGGLRDHYHAGGVANLTAVQSPDTGLDHFHWFTRAPGASEWSVVSGAAGPSYGFIVRTEHNGLEVQARLYGADHTVVAETAPAVIVVDDHGNDPYNGHTITATLPVNEGALVVSVPQEARDVQLTNFELTPAADRYRSTGALGGILVTDTRSANPGWTVSGRVRAFTTVDGAELAGANLGWTPTVLQSSAGQTVQAGGSAAPLLAGGPGVSAWTPLASAAAGSGVGQAEIGADLTLEAPLDLAPGTYKGMLILTAI